MAHSFLFPKNSAEDFYKRTPDDMIISQGGSMENTSVENRPIKNLTSHSNFRKGMTDYNDGENVSQYLGNDDYPEGANLPDPCEYENNKLDGKSASGNDFLEDDPSSETNQEIKFDEGIDYE